MPRGPARLVVALAVLGVVGQGVASAAAGTSQPVTADAVLEDALRSVAADGDDAEWEDRALAGAVQELAGLEDLDAVRPDETVIALVTIVDGRITTIAELQAIDAANSALLDEPRGAELRPSVAAVLAPLTADQLAAARAGDESVDAAPWVDAVQGLVVDAMEAERAAQEEQRRSAAVAPVVVLLAALAALAVVGGTVLVRRRTSTERVTAAVAHCTAVVLEASRRMTGAVDDDEVRRIALRTAVELADADDAVWVRATGDTPEWGTATPGAALGEITGQGGVIAEALRTGRTASGRGGDEPWLAVDGGTVVAVPVIDEGRVTGALVVARRQGDVVPSAVHGLSSLGPVTASAVAAATAHRGAIDAAMADPLTALPNRRRLDLDLAAAGRTGRYALAMVDVDHFKHLNDTHGHAAGDLALQLIARALGGAVRGGDTVYRYGGEEFCVLLPLASDPAVAEVVADRLRQAIGDTAVPGGEDQPGGRLTASVGVAVRRQGQSPEEVLFAADAALYRAKQEGRDRTVLAA